MKHFVVLLFVAALAAGAAYFNVVPKATSSNDIAAVRIGEAVISAEVAKTEQEIARGLSGREALPKGSGMLFVFDEPGKYGFWMKNMKFSLDIVWIRDNAVIGISEGLEPEGELPVHTYRPSEPVNYVLEVPAGFVEKNGIRIDSPVFYVYRE